MAALGTNLRVARWTAAARVLALPAARLAIAIASGVFAVAVIAGALRTLPMLLAPGVPLGVAPAFARGVAAVALETALFVAPPIAFAVIAARAVDRGELRALAAIGVSPGALVAASWPAALGIALSSGLAAAAWGEQAAHPGALVRELIAEGRAACARAEGAAAVEVPLLGVTWICFPGEAPRAVGAALGGVGRASFAAASLEASDDLRELRADGLTLVLPPTADGASARVSAGSVSIRALAPIMRASNLAPVERAALLGGGAVAMAALAAALVFGLGLRGRVRALALGAVGPAAALLAFSHLERAPASGAAYAFVPIAGLAAMGLVARIGARRR